MKEKYQKSRQTTLEYLLLSLVPYSKPNLKLVFLPGRFFADLEAISRANKRTLYSTLSRAQKQGLVQRIDGVPVLTAKGREKIEPYQTKKLDKDTMLMVIFDIPEEIASKRRRLRNFLRYHQFRQVQKSVWVSNMDYQKQLQNLLEELQIQEFVEMFECARLR